MGRVVVIKLRELLLDKGMTKIISSKYVRHATISELAN
jgi:hypothetical protein